MNTYYSYGYNRQQIITDLKNLEVALKSKEAYENQIEKFQKELEAKKASVNVHNHIPPKNKYVEQVELQINERRNKQLRKMLWLPTVLTLIISIAIGISTWFMVKDLSFERDHMVFDHILSIAFCYSPVGLSLLLSKFKAKHGRKLTAITYFLAFYIVFYYIITFPDLTVWLYYAILVATVTIISILTPIVFKIKSNKIQSSFTKEETALLAKARSNELQEQEAYQKKVAETLKENQSRYMKEKEGITAAITNLKYHMELNQMKINNSTVVHHSYKNLDCIQSVIDKLERYPDYTLTDALKSYDKYRSDILITQLKYEHDRFMRDLYRDEINQTTSQITTALNGIRDAENERTKIVEDELYKLRRDLNNY